jgi:hypothetical protein
MIADLVENGFGLWNTLCLVNGHLDESGRDIISKSALCGVIQRLKARNIPVKKRQQGSTGALPDYFNKEKLMMIDIERTLWFDESTAKR